MTHDMQIDSLRECILPLRNWDMPIQLYYDETNNFRSLTLNQQGLNAPDNKTFVLGGVALLPDTEITEWQQLRKLLHMQSNAPEIKFRYLANGNYEEVLNSHKLELFLQWLLDHNMMVHYSALDLMYWSITDIIDSLLADTRLQINCLYHMQLKAELYHAVMQNLSEFLTLSYGFGYPNVPREQARLFLEAVLGFVNKHVAQDRNRFTGMLRRVLQSTLHLADLELVFLHDNRQGELISDFSTQFQHCIYVFKNASHVFDKESRIEKIFSQLELREGERRLNYRFVDSKAEVGIQLSDVVAGLFGRHFDYLRGHSLKELMLRKDGFTSLQLGNLSKLRTLVDCSDEFSDGLFHQVMPLDTCFKNNAFLHESDDVPPFMWA